MSPKASPPLRAKTARSKKVEPRINEDHEQGIDRFITDRAFGRRRNVRRLCLGLIGSAKSRLKLLVVATNEELLITRDTLRLIKNQRTNPCS